MFDGEQFVAVVAAHAQCAIAGEVARGFEQADGVHQVFRVVALAVRLGAGVARRVAFARPLLVFGVGAAVRAVAVGVVAQVGERCIVRRGGVFCAESGSGGIALDAAVATAAVCVVVNGVEVARVRQADEADAALLAPAAGEPGGKWQGARTIENVAEVERGFRGDGRVDFFVEAARFFDLAEGVAGEGLLARLAEKPRRAQRVHQWRALADGVGRRGEQFECGRVAGEEQFDEPPQFVVGGVVARVADLREVVEAVVKAARQVENALDVGIGLRRGEAVGVAAGDGLKEDEVFRVQVGKRQHGYTRCKVVRKSASSGAVAGAGGTGAVSAATSAASVLVSAMSEALRRWR